MERISVSASAYEASQSSARQVQPRPAASGFSVNGGQVGAASERAGVAQSGISLSGRAREVSAISNSQSRPEAAAALLAMIRSAGAPRPDPISPTSKELAVRRPEAALSMAESSSSRPEPARRRISIYV